MVIVAKITKQNHRAMSVQDSISVRRHFGCQQFDRLPDPAPHGRALKVALFQKLIRPLGCVKRRIVAVLFEDEMDGPECVEVGNYVRPIVNELWRRVPDCNQDLRMPRDAILFHCPPRFPNSGATRFNQIHCN